MDTPRLTWDTGTAYDMFISLEVLHNPDQYGLRGSWAAGVRSRLPAEERELLQQVMNSWLWPLPWVMTLPSPRDGRTVLRELAKIPAAERIPTLASCHMDEWLRDFFSELMARGTWDREDLTKLKSLVQSMHKEEKGKKKHLPPEKELQDTLTVWANVEAYGEGWLAALRAYHEVFFAEEEARIRPALESAVAQAQELAQTVTLPALLEELSQGLRFTEDLNMPELLLVPSFWITPLTIFAHVKPEGGNRWLFVFGGRPANASLVPGEAVPDLLYQTLKALADPTRLRILHYLSAEPMTPAELARLLRLRAPTVIHHLHTLRLARLVHLTISHEGRRYEARREAVRATCPMLEEYLDGGEWEPAGGE